MGVRFTGLGATVRALLTAVALTGLCSLTAAAQAGGTEGGAIVGLWQVHYTSDFGPQFDTYQQWHSDGMDIESPSFAPGVCMGVWKQLANRSIELYHVGWTPGGVPPAPTAVRFVLTTTSTVSVDRNSFDGRYDQQFFDAEGNLVLEDIGATHASRISVEQRIAMAGKTTAKSTRAFC